MKAAQVVIYGNHDTAFRCGKCESLNISDGTMGERIVCPDCKTVNLIPDITYCDCEDCHLLRNRRK